MATAVSDNLVSWRQSGLKKLVLTVQFIFQSYEHYEKSYMSYFQFGRY